MDEALPETRARRRTRSRARAQRPAYVDLYFGKSDSKNELADNRDEFVRSFVDLGGSVAAVLDSRTFLVLGPKGTGKSALAWYLEASVGADSPHMARVKDASSLPLAEVPRLKTGQSEGPERTVVAWKFILLCNLLELLLQDHGCSSTRDPEVIRVTNLLRDWGFMSDAVGRALTKGTKTTTTIPIPGLGELYKRESGKQLNIYNLIPYMEQWVTEAASDTRHILLLDGLDSILLNDPRYDESLSSLVQAAYQVNQRLADANATGSVVLLLRNDIFSRVALLLPDSQKMRDDMSLDLDWRVLSGAAGVHAPLLELVNRKAANALEVDAVDVLSYFPKEIEVGKRGGRTRNFPVLQYLLNMTRHTPRDVLRIFEEIRRVEASGVFAKTSRTLSQEVIREGVVQYASKYFVNAIRNEFAGTEGGPERAESALKALKAMNRQAFDRAEFKTALGEVGGDPADADGLLTLLFYAGAIGNSTGIGDKSYMQFYHRRDDAEIYLHGSFILHNALIHAWNLNRGSSGRGGRGGRQNRAGRAGAPSSGT